MLDNTNLSLHVAPEIMEQYAGTIQYTFDHTHRTYFQSVKLAMDYFYQCPEPMDLLYAADLLVIFVCKFAGKDDVELADSMGLPLLIGELINVDAYQVYRPQGDEATWTADTEIYPEMELIVVD